MNRLTEIRVTRRKHIALVVACVSVCLFPLAHGSAISHAKSNQPERETSITAAEMCPRFERNSSEVPQGPITCVSGDELVPARNLGVPLDSADSEVRAYVQGVNERIDDFHKGILPNDDQIKSDNQFLNEEQVFRSLHMPQYENPTSWFTPQANLDRAFLVRALATLRAIDDSADKIRAEKQIERTRAQELNGSIWYCESSHIPYPYADTCEVAWRSMSVAEVSDTRGAAVASGRVKLSFGPAWGQFACRIPQGTVMNSSSGAQFSPGSWHRAESAFEE